METASSSKLICTTMPSSPYSLGLVSEFVSRFPPFNNFEFGKMVQSLLYQLEAGTHVAAGLDDRIVGYVGWIKTTRLIAEAWLNHNGELHATFDDPDAIAVTVLVTEKSRYILPLIKHAKTMNSNYSVYWKRHLRDGQTSAMRGVRKKALT